MTNKRGKGQPKKSPRVKRTAKLNARFSEGRYALAEAKARSEGVTLSCKVRQLVDVWIDGNEG